MGGSAQAEVDESGRRISDALAEGIYNLHRDRKAREQSILLHNEIIRCTTHSKARWLSSNHYGKWFTDSIYQAWRSRAQPSCTNGAADSEV